MLDNLENELTGEASAASNHNLCIVSSRAVKARRSPRVRRDLLSQVCVGGHMISVVVSIILLCKIEFA